MPCQNSSPPTSPLIPTNSNEDLATPSRHANIDSVQSLEIAELEKRVKELQANEASLKWGRDQLFQELKICKSDLAKEKQEARRFAGKLSKECRNVKALGEELVTLREGAERKAREIEIKLDREKKKRIKEQKDTQKAVADLQSQLNVKQSKTKELEGQSQVKKLDATQAEIDATRDTVHRPQSSSLTCELYTDKPSPVRSSLLPQLYDTIKYLQKENVRFQNMYHEDGCEEYRSRIFQQMGDAKDLQAAAEAETEGLRHLAKANADLIDGHVIDVKCIKELIQEKDHYRIKAKEHEQTTGELRIEQHLASGVAEESGAASLSPQPLGFSPLAYIYTAPIAPEVNKAETSEYMQRLRTAELEVESLTSQKDSILFEHAQMKTREQPSKSSLRFSAIVCLESEPELASSSKTSLTFSDLQAISTIPRTPIHAITPLTNPDLLSHLEDLGQFIMSLSTAPPTKLQPTPLLPHVALVINIQPTEKRNYSLLQRVQSAISATSSLDIHGPKEVVKQFVASMHDVETDHAEKSKLVCQLDKAAKQHRADIEALETQLRDKTKCSNPTHRILAEELEAKNVQFAMQERLLADWGKRNL